MDRILTGWYQERVAPRIPAAGPIRPKVRAFALFAPSTRILLLQAADPFHLVWVALAARLLLRFGAAAVSGRHAPGWDVGLP